MKRKAVFPPIQVDEIMQSQFGVEFTTSSRST